jgi:hypothetical protein
MHTPDRPRRRTLVPLVVVSVLVACTGAAVVAIPALITAASPVEERHYASWAEAPSEQQDPAAARPTWAPEDATEIDMAFRVRRDAPGWNVAMTAPDGFDTSACTEVPVGGGAPALDSAFMPDRVPQRVWTCGDGRAVWADGDRLYGANTGTWLGEG